MTQSRVSVSAVAKRQIRQAVAWWQRNRIKAPSALRDELRDAFELLSRHPLAGRLIDEPEFRDVRRLSLNRTHYFLFYEVEESEVIIRGLRHQSREGGDEF